jgi:hypothetical protein
VQFLVRIGEYFASSISNTSTTKQMKGLLEESGIHELTKCEKQREEGTSPKHGRTQAIQEEMERKQRARNTGHNNQFPSACSYRIRSSFDIR